MADGPPGTVGGGNGLRLLLEPRQAAVLARAVAHAAKTTGAELVFAAVAYKSFRVHGVSRARTACLDVLFKPQFFESYSVKAVGGVVTFSVYAKSLLAVLKKARRGQLQIIYDVDSAARLHCTVRYQNGLVMNYAIDCLDNCEVVNSGANAAVMPCQVVLQSSELSRLLAAFQPKLEDVRITAFPDGWHEANGSRKQCAVKLESCADNGNIDLYTELLVPNESLVDFDVKAAAGLGGGGAPVSVSTCMKDIKSMAHFCQALEVDIGLSFTQAGMPLVLSTKYKTNISEQDVDWSAKLVLATLFNRGDATQKQQQQQQHPEQRQRRLECTPRASDADTNRTFSDEHLGEVSPSDGANGEELLHIRGGGADYRLPVPVHDSDHDYDDHQGTSQAAVSNKRPRLDAQVHHQPRHLVLVSDSQTPTQQTVSDRGQAAGRALHALQHDNDFGYDSPNYVGGSTDHSTDDEDEEFIDASQ